MLHDARLLVADEGEPVAIERPMARGPFVLVCEHASNRVPKRLGNLGLDAAALEAHIAWDPGALALSKALSEKLDAILVYQRFSRLAYDCNRPPEAPDAIPSNSEIYTIPGNADLSDAERQARVNDLYLPFQDALSAVLKARRQDGLASVLVTIHSFTPIYRGVSRTVEIGVLHDSDSRLADVLLEEAEDTVLYDIQRNAPYGPSDGVTHTLKLHGLENGLLNVMIEVRNDLLTNELSQGVMADFLAGLLLQSMARLS